MPQFRRPTGNINHPNRWEKELFYIIEISGIKSTLFILSGKASPLLQAFACTRIEPQKQKGKASHFFHTAQALRMTLKKDTVIKAFTTGVLKAATPSCFWHRCQG